MNISEIITISPSIQSGEAVFSKTRVPIKNLFDYLKAGDTLEEFLHDFPSVQKSQAIGLLTYFENLFVFRKEHHENNFA